MVEPYWEGITTASLLSSGSHRQIKSILDVYWRLPEFGDYRSATTKAGAWQDKKDGLLALVVVAAASLSTGYRVGV